MRLTGSTSNCSPDWRAWLVVTTAIGLAGTSVAQQDVMVDVRQGTDFAVAVSPDKQQLTIDLLGQLWELPARGGGAVMLSEGSARLARPQYSPDGRLLVYERFEPGGSDIWFFDFQTREHKPLVVGPADDREPAFSNDGTEVYFTSDRAGTYSLWRQRVASAAVPVSVFTAPGDVRSPAISELGDIAFVVSNPGSGSSLWLRTVEGARELVRTAGKISAPSWRPDGGVIVYHQTGDTGEHSLRMAILSDGLITRELTGGEDLFTTPVAWLSQLEFVYAADGQIWRRELAGFSRRPIHLFAAVPVAPAPTARLSLDLPPTEEVSVSGVTADDHARVFSSAGDIWLQRAADLRRLTDDMHTNLDPILAPDDNTVYFASDRDGRMQIWRLRADQPDEPQQITFGPLRAHGATLDISGTRLAYLTTDGMGPDTQAQVNVRYLDDGVLLTSAAGVNGARRLRWLEEDSEAALGVDFMGAAGNLQSRRFDPSLRVLNDAAAGIAPPAGPDTAVSRRPLETRMPELQPAGPAGASFVLQVGRLFDGIRSGYRRHIDIHVVDGRIAEVTARGRISSSAPIIDASELTVLPGLIDVHAHATNLAPRESGRGWLSQGVTTVRMGGSDIATLAELGALWSLGRPPGPRLIIVPDRGSTAAVSRTAAIVEPSPRFIDDPVDRMRRELVGERAVALGNPELIPAPLLFRAAPGRRQYQDTIGLVSASGFAEVTSLNLSFNAAWLTWLRRDAVLNAQFERAFDTNDRRLWTRPAGSAAEHLARSELLRRLIRSSAFVGVGSEAPLTPPGFGLTGELVQLVQLGIEPEQALRVATSGAALAMGIERDLGTIEAGKRADFLLLEGDPLERIEEIINIRAIAVNGRWYQAAELLP